MLAETGAAIVAGVAREAPALGRSTSVDAHARTRGVGRTKPRARRALDAAARRVWPRRDRVCAALTDAAEHRSVRAALDPARDRADPLPRSRPRSSSPPGCRPWCGTRSTSGRGPRTATTWCPGPSGTSVIRTSDRCTWPGGWPRRPCCGPGPTGRSGDSTIPLRVAPGSPDSPVQSRTEGDTDRHDGNGELARPRRSGSHSVGRAAPGIRRSITSTRSPTSTSSRSPPRSACSAAPRLTGSSGSTAASSRSSASPRTQVLGRDWLRVGPSARPTPRRRRAPSTCTPSRTSSALQFRIVRSDGAMRHVRVRVLPGHRAAGRAARVRRRDGGRDRARSNGMHRPTVERRPPTRSARWSSRRRSASSTPT